MASDNTFESPCVNCDIRKWYARKFDMHFSGEDCIYICEVYENWKKRRETDAGQVFGGAENN